MSEYGPPNGPGRESDPRRPGDGQGTPPAGSQDQTGPLRLPASQQGDGSGWAAPSAAPAAGAPGWSGAPAQPDPQQGWQNAPGPQGWQPPAGAPQGWQSPPAGAPQGWAGDPAAPQQGWDPNTGQPTFQQDTEPPKQKSRGPILVIAAALVALLLVGTGVWYFAYRDTKPAAGASTPQAAVETFATALSSNDLVGMATALDPAEGSVYQDFNVAILDEMKRLEIIKSDVEPNSLTGSTITVSGLTYGATTTPQPDHLAFVEVTGGTLTVTSDPSKVPFTDKIDTALSDALGPQWDEMQGSAQTQTVNIADATQELGHPLRIATVMRDGEWYPSVFYTVAGLATDAAGLAQPTAADTIPAAGADSESAAVDQLIAAATAGDLEKVIGLLPPDEMGVVHDYGKLLIQQTGEPTAEDLGGVGFSNAQWDVTDVAGGRKVSLLSADVETPEGTVTITRDVAAGTLTISGIPDQPTITLDDATLESLASQMGEDLDPQVLDIVKREFKQLIGLGVVTTQVDGKWYVSPIRTGSDVLISLMKGLEPADIDYFISLAGN
ncbi:hypothetical protein JL107_01845 [Nakamurella flavida]|uniref:Uncharacterized protein n=1 Tax=Nakamurella flavida TaxID=363630 RepID=A0A938YLE7_9ACTN|nr:hypothetical protein [Nakamurella flavida]MBM9475178.1 hypothetical protein [Nakamurella flavida]MDP9776751.1 hypothetical protein [Nakamurella flavida]